MTDQHAQGPAQKRTRTPPTNGGRPPGAKSIRVKASKLVDKSLRVLEEVMDDEGASPMSKVEASRTVLALAGMPVPSKAPRE